MTEYKIGNVKFDATIAVPKSFGPVIYEIVYEAIATVSRCSH